jgi:GTP pyrophosphokinase
MIIAMAQDIASSCSWRTHAQHADAGSWRRSRRGSPGVLDITRRSPTGWASPGSRRSWRTLPHIKPQEFRELQDKVSKRKAEREQDLEDVIDLIRTKMQEHGIQGEVSGRFKHLYSIYKKMKAHGIEFEQVPDVIAFRLIMPTIPACYEALGIIHQTWKPVPGRFKDFIAIPKPNMYQSPTPR